jgi:cation transport ATPase
MEPCRISAISIGNAALMQDLGAKPESLKERAEGLQKEGETVMLIASDGHFAGLAAVADPIKKSALGTAVSRSKLDTTTITTPSSV